MKGRGRGGGGRGEEAEEYWRCRQRQKQGNMKLLSSFGLRTCNLQAADKKGIRSFLEAVLAGRHLWPTIMLHFVSITGKAEASLTFELRTWKGLATVFS